MYYDHAYGWRRIGNVRSITPHWGIEASLPTDANYDTPTIRAHTPTDSEPPISPDVQEVGDIRINVGLGKLQWWTGTAWETITSA